MECDYKRSTFFPGSVFNSIGEQLMDLPTTILFIVLGVATVIYVIAMIEAVTRKPDEKPGSQFNKPKKGKLEKQPAKEKEKTWPPKEES